MGPITDAFVLDQRLTSAKARRELGWRPKHNALQTLREMIAGAHLRAS